MQRVAHWISIILHPSFLFPLGMCYLLFGLPGYFAYWPVELRVRLLLVNILFTAILPMVILLLLKWGQMVDSIYLRERDERPLPMVFFAACHVLNAYQLMRWGAPFILSGYALGAGFMVALLALVSLKWKFSAHATGAGGLCGLLVCAYWFGFQEIRLALMAALLLSGVIAWARVVQHAHTPKEWWQGYFLGLITMMLTYTAGWSLI